MYVLEVETKKKLKRICNPRKARFRDRILFDSLQIMDDNGKWHTVCHCCIGVGTALWIVDDINSAIKKKEASVYVDI